MHADVVPYHAGLAVGAAGSTTPAPAARRVPPAADAPAAGAGVPVLHRLPDARVLVGHKGSLVEAPPPLLPLWDKVCLEPVGSPKPVVYFVLCPEEHLQLARFFFRDLTATYQAFNLGMHRAAHASQLLRSFNGIIPIPSITIPGTSAPVCQLAAAAAGPQSSATATAAADGNPQQQQQQQQPWPAPLSLFHPVLGALSNQALGFRPGLAEPISVVAPTTPSQPENHHNDQQQQQQRGAAAAAAPAGESAMLIGGLQAEQARGCGADVGSCNGSGSADSDGQQSGFWTNLRYALEMLQLVLSNQPQPANRLGYSLDDSSPAAAVVYVVPPADDAATALRCLLEVAARLSPCTPSGAAARARADAAGTASAADGAAAHTGAAAAAAAAGAASSGALPPGEGSSAGEQELVKRYGGAARDTYVALLGGHAASVGSASSGAPAPRIGSSGGGAAPADGPAAAGAAAAGRLPGKAPGPGTLKLATSATPPTEPVELTLQLVMPEVMKDLSGQSVQALALAVYNKVRRLPSCLDEPAAAALTAGAREAGAEATGAGRGSTAIPASEPGSASAPSSSRVVDAAAGAAATAPLASTSGRCLLYEPLVAAVPPAAPEPRAADAAGAAAGAAAGPSGAAPVTPFASSNRSPFAAAADSLPQQQERGETFDQPCCTLHCSYSLALGSSSGSGGRAWLSMCWTDSSGMMLQRRVQAVELPPGIASVSAEAGQTLGSCSRERGQQQQHSHSRGHADTGGAAAAAAPTTTAALVCSTVLRETLQLFDRIRSRAGGSAACEGSDHEGQSTLEVDMQQEPEPVCGGSSSTNSLPSRIVITHVGVVHAVESAAWASACSAVLEARAAAAAAAAAAEPAPAAAAAASLHNPRIVVTSLQPCEAAALEAVASCMPEGAYIFAHAHNAAAIARPPGVPATAAGEPAAAVAAVVGASAVLVSFPHRQPVAAPSSSVPLSGAAAGEAWRWMLHVVYDSCPGRTMALHATTLDATPVSQLLRRQRQQQPRALVRAPSAGLLSGLAEAPASTAVATGAIGGEAASSAALVRSKSGALPPLPPPPSDSGVSRKRPAGDDAAAQLHGSPSSGGAWQQQQPAEPAPVSAPTATAAAAPAAGAAPPAPGEDGPGAAPTKRVRVWGRRAPSATELPELPTVPPPAPAPAPPPPSPPVPAAAAPKAGSTGVTSPGSAAGGKAPPPPPPPPQQQQQQQQSAAEAAAGSRSPPDLRQQAAAAAQPHLENLAAAAAVVAQAALAAKPPCMQPATPSAALCQELHQLTVVTEAYAALCYARLGPAHGAGMAPAQGSAAGSTPLPLHCAVALRLAELCAACDAVLAGK